MESTMAPAHVFVCLKLMNPIKVYEHRKGSLKYDVERIVINFIYIRLK